MRHLLAKDNIALLIKRQGKLDFSYIFVAKIITESCTFESAYANNTVCPLHISNGESNNNANLNNNNTAFFEEICGRLKPEDVFDYIYAVLHSPSYREKYKQFLKTDFPRVPYPRDKQVFQELAKLGKELRELHLLESPKVNNFVTTYPVPGTDTVEVIKRDVGKVFINDTQFFGDVPEVAWNFWIGGYQPAQKWLKDRKEKVLTNEDIEHYQKMIVALTETDRVMRDIDKINFF